MSVLVKRFGTLLLYAPAKFTIFARRLVLIWVVFAWFTFGAVRGCGAAVGAGGTGVAFRRSRLTVPFHEPVHIHTPKEQSK